MAGLGRAGLGRAGLAAPGAGVTRGGRGPAPAAGGAGGRLLLGSIRPPLCSAPPRPRLGPPRLPGEAAPRPAAAAFALARFAGAALFAPRLPVLLQPAAGAR